MRTRRRLTLLAVCGLVALMVAAGTGTGSPAATTQLTVAVWSDWQFVQRAADAYMKAHPNVKIKVSAIPGEQYFASLPRTLGSGGADITVLQVTGTGPYKGLVDEHALADLSGIWKKQGLARAMPAGVTQSYVSADGGRYAVNVDETLLPFVFYDKDLFTKLGIGLPTGHRVTLAQFNAIADKLKAANYIPMRYDWVAGAHHLFQQYLLSSCGDKTYYALALSWKPGGSARWTQPCVVRAIQAEKDLKDRGVFGSSPLVGFDEATAAFIAQKSGMLLTGMWVVSQLQKEAKFNWDWFLMPPPQGGRPTKIILYTADGLGVNARSKNVDVAKDFLATIMSKKTQASLLIDGRPPSRTDVPVPKGANPKLVQMVKSMVTLGSATHFVGILTPPDFQDTIQSSSQQLLLGSLSPADFAGRLQTLAEKLRAKK